MTTIVWIDDDFADPGANHVSSFDHGFVAGDGVFEGCEVIDGVPFALTRHLERLEISARGLGLVSPNEQRVRHAIAQVSQAWHAQEPGAVARLRITWTSGLGPLGSNRGDGPGLLVIAATGMGSHPPASVHVVPWVRNERSALAGLKTTSYGENVVALARAHAVGASEAIFGNTRGELCEGTGTNVFLEDERGLVTPPLSSGALAGVTRSLVLEWALEAGLPVREEVLPLASIHNAEHVALTSSSRGIAPVIAVDGVAKSPGQLTLAMGEIFARNRARDPDP